MSRVRAAWRNERQCSAETTSECLGVPWRCDRPAGHAGHHAAITTYGAVVKRWARRARA